MNPQFSFFPRIGKTFSKGQTGWSMCRFPFIHFIPSSSRHPRLLPHHTAAEHGCCNVALTPDINFRNFIQVLWLAPRLMWPLCDRSGWRWSRPGQSRGGDAGQPPHQAQSGPSREETQTAASCEYCNYKPVACSSFLMLGTTADGLIDPFTDT